MHGKSMRAYCDPGNPCDALCFAGEVAAMRNRRRFVPAFVCVFFGLMAFINVVTKPRFATYYRPDVVTLVAVGMCFGAAIALLAVALRESRVR